MCYISINLLPPTADCIYRRLEKVALVGGNKLDNVPGATLMDCEQKCDKRKGCNNFDFWAPGCDLRDKQIIESDPQTDAHDNSSFTSYKSCRNGNSSISM